MKKTNKIRLLTVNKKINLRRLGKIKEEENGWFKKAALGIVTLLTIVIAASQAYIAYKQYEASKLTFAPIFVFREQLIKSEESQKYDNENMEIVNMGYPINNYSSKLDVYIKATKTITTGDGSEKKIYIPIDYYSAAFPLSGGKDTLETLLGFNNNTDFVNLIWAINDLAPKKGEHGPYYDIKIIKSITITYSDIEGNEHKVYFLNQKPVGYEKIEKIKKLSKKIVTTRHINRITAHEIADLIESHGN